jgi:hypothetical protein
MGFFDALRRVLRHDTHAHVDDDTKKRIREVWGLDQEEPGSEDERKGTTAGEPAGTASPYDRAQWAKKLRKVLEELPGSQPSWHDLMTEAHALKFEPGWIADRQREGLVFLIRQAVSHRVVSEDDHHKLDLARKLIGIPEAEAERILHEIMAEAEAFFGAPVKEEA